MSTAILQGNTYIIRKDFIMNCSINQRFTPWSLLKFAAPSIVMMIFTSIYGVVDGLFVSNYAGKTAFAAINLVMPFIMVLGGIGFMIGTGGTALVSKILGEGDQEKATLISIIFLLAKRRKYHYM